MSSGFAMRKALTAALLLLANLFCVVNVAHAAGPSVTAGNIFSTIGGTTTIDRGGSMHSQARSIYSLGGGMSSFKGKRVSLIALDPPGFSAGCSGISWHFGGFAFISADEIRQLVEAVAQASLGVAVDLAMQTLCPQCYAVMAKLRDISNLMRNAAADACAIAQNIGSMISDKYVPGGAKSNCAQVEAAGATDKSWLGSMSAGICSQLGTAEGKVKEAVDRFNSWSTTGTTPGNKTPTKDIEQAYGNLTYNGLTNLGYMDGIAKDILMSYLGMNITIAGESNCATALKNVWTTARDDTARDAASMAILDLGARMGQVEKADGASATTADANPKPPNNEVTGSAKGPQNCALPPLLTRSFARLDKISEVLVCGIDPMNDARLFARTWVGAGTVGVTDAEALSMLAASSLGELCNIKNSDFVGPPAPVTDSSNPRVYTCRQERDGHCWSPRMVRLSDLIGETGSTTRYTGLTWMILDALYRGVASMQDGTKPLEDTTKAVLNGSGYPLYRLLNMAAVYPGMADDLLQAYGGVIAVQYVLDTLDKLMAVGSQPSFQTSPKAGLSPGQMAQLREEISTMTIRFGEARSQVLARMHEKRALVDAIVQVNRTLQAEVVSRGLGDNSNMAVSLKKLTSIRE